MAVWSKLQAFVFGGAVARGASDAVTPVLEPVRQHAWQQNQLRVLDPNTAARLVVQAGVDYGQAAEEASRNGYDANRLSALIYLAYGVPSIGEALNLRRRGEITVEQLHHVYAKESIEPQYWPHLDVLLDELLSPGELAAAIHRGLIPDPGLLMGEQPSGPRNVPSYPVYPINALEEAAGHGFDRKRLGVLVGLQGLPMGVIEAAQSFYRKIITHGDYIAAFNESNNRNEWAEAVLEYARQIPTARDFFENALRGYHDLAWAQQQAERHGMTPEDSLVIYQNQGRPMNIRQITQALSRGGVFHPEPGELTDPYDASIVEGNIKPAYYDLAKALQYTLPSPFVMRQLTVSGVWSEEKAAQRLRDSGWIPEDAAEAAHAWASGSSGTGDPHLSKAQTQLWTTTHSSYISGEADDAAAVGALEAAGVAGSAVSSVLGLWRHERELRRKQLTPAQIKKAYAKSSRNEATGQAWTRDEALAALIERGYSALDAGNYLEIP